MAMTQKEATGAAENMTLAESLEIATRGAAPGRSGSAIGSAPSSPAISPT